MFKPQWEQHTSLTLNNNSSRSKRRCDHPEVRIEVKSPWIPNASHKRVVAIGTKLVEENAETLDASPRHRRT
jgi:hypothetical protein